MNFTFIIIFFSNKLIETFQNVQVKYISNLNIMQFFTGVIGTCKLHFDIWGDSVNVASRMYSTAEPNKIQLTKKAKDVLQEEKWSSDCFSYRGKVFVKGKGHMDTFYFKEPSTSKCNWRLLIKWPIMIFSPYLCYGRKIIHSKHSNPTFFTVLANW